MRFWNELVAAWGDAFSLPLTVLILVLLALITGLLWYFWPAWYEALMRISFRRSGSRSGKAASRVREVTEDELRELIASEEELPAVDPIVFAALADRYAAEGRFADAVRERLRAMVRELVQQGVIAHHPGWTVTELAREAGVAKPPTGPPVESASQIFSDIWYAKRPAHLTHDNRMRDLAGQLHDVMAGGRW